MPKFEFDSLIVETEVESLQNSDLKVVRFDGRIGNNNAFEISQNINVVFEGEIYNLILDLSKLDYINSVGVATLLTMIKTVDQHSGKIVIGGINHFIESVIKLMELPKKVKIHYSIDEAKKEFA